MVLKFTDAEKRVNGMLVFPAFSLSVEKGQVIAIYTDVNIKKTLIDFLMDKKKKNKINKKNSMIR